MVEETPAEPENQNQPSSADVPAEPAQPVAEMPAEATPAEPTVSTEPLLQETAEQLPAATPEAPVAAPPGGSEPSKNSPIPSLIKEGGGGVPEGSGREFSGEGGIIRELLLKAKEAIQDRKRKKLQKILQLVQQKGSIRNDEVEKALRMSDSTATRYLNELIREGKIKRVGVAEHARYEPA